MRLYIYDDKEAVGAWTAEYIASRINSFGATEERPFVLGLPTGVCPCV
jgi:glucosamine-6-phosphate deaminase